MSKVSIIVPVYGVEKYIERCAKSLFEQTFDDIEYVFVNDCTMDASIEVLQSVIKDYPNRSSQIKILNHDKNKGLPQARKTGIIAATGDYIINFDSDDWVDKTIIDTLYSKALLDCADVVICDLSISDGINNRQMKGGAELSKISFFEQMCKMKYPWSTCNKLIKHSLCNGINFPVCNMAEDMALITQIMVKANKISYVPQPLYYYYQNPQSMTKVLTEKSIIKMIDDYNNNNEIVFQAIKEFLPHKKYLKYVEMFKWHVKKIAWQMLNIDKKHYIDWISLHHEINLSLFFNPYISFVDKSKCILTYLRVYPLMKK